MKRVDAAEIGTTAACANHRLLDLRRERMPRCPGTFALGRRQSRTTPLAAVVGGSYPTYTKRRDETSGNRPV